MDDRLSRCQLCHLLGGKELDLGAKGCGPYGRSPGRLFAVTDLARTECLAGPLHKGDAAVVADFQVFFNDPDIQVLPLTAAVCERAAHLRAASNFQFAVPDCLHLAAAIVHGCGLFLTNDAQLRSCTAITVEIL